MTMLGLQYSQETEDRISQVMTGRKMINKMRSY